MVTPVRPLLISPLNALPKADGYIRLIHYCSQPPGEVLNDYVFLQQKSKYQTMQDVVDVLTPGCFLTQIDLKSVYRSVNIHPSQYQFTGLK